jgi:hypothetical protein
LSFAGDRAGGIEDASDVIEALPDDVVVVALPASPDAGGPPVAPVVSDPTVAAPAAADAATIALNWSGMTQVKPKQSW